MKRGLITWTKSQIPPEVFDRRMERVREVLAEQGLPALVVYSELWRSNHGRYFSNFMPYFNRALLVLPADGEPTLLCGLSPRVYPWIRSVTTIEDVRRGGNFADPLSDLAKERGWREVGVLDANALPDDIYRNLKASGIGIDDVSPAGVFEPGRDETEMSMRRTALRLARLVVSETLGEGVGRLDHELVGRLEGRLRHAQAEDVIILLSNGDTTPSPACGETLEEGYSISLAVEYRGHWVRISRPAVQPEVETSLRDSFRAALHEGASGGTEILIEDLSGSYPYQWADRSALPAGSIFAMHCETVVDGQRVFYGDTCQITPAGAMTI